MSWLYLFLVVGAALAIGRIVFQLKKLREQPVDDWAAKLIERMRRGGADPFRPVDVDFFLAMPSETAASHVAQSLTGEGFRVDVRPVADSAEQPFSVHAVKSMHLNADGIRAVSVRLREVAVGQGGRYDGWTAGRASEG